MKTNIVFEVAAYDFLDSLPLTTKKYLLYSKVLTHYEFLVKSDSQHYFLGAVWIVYNWYQLKKRLTILPLNYNILKSVKFSIKFVS